MERCRLLQIKEEFNQNQMIKVNLEIIAAHTQIFFPASKTINYVNIELIMK